MNSISEVFTICATENRAALMPFITCGYPSMAEFTELANSIANDGADIIEIGFPHSDPLADGPVIQKSSHLALSGGFTVDSGFELIRGIAPKINQPIVIMTYINPILKTGARKFIKKCKDSGVQGLIVPDLPLEESDEIRTLCASSGLSLIYLITPTTPIERMERICAQASGFIYFVSVTGTTGARVSLNGNLGNQVAKIRKFTSLPICVGFGVSTAEMAAAVASIGDGVIIGSKLLQLIDENSNSDRYKQVGTFLKEVRMRLGEKT